MAHDFVAGSSDSLAASTSPVSGPPLTLICWAYIPSIGDYALVGVGDVDSDTDYWFLGTIATGSKARMTAKDSGGGDKAVTTDPVPTSTWVHLGGVAASSTSRAIYLNGGYKGTNATSITPNTPDNLRISGTPDASVGAYPTAYIAEVVVLDIAATDAEILAHAQGVDPRLIWPASNIVLYKDLIRDINRGWGATLAGTTTGIVAHPPIIYPSAPRTVYFTPNPDTFALHLRGTRHAFRSYGQDLRGTHRFMLPRALHLRGAHEVPESTTYRMDLRGRQSIGPPAETFALRLRGAHHVLDTYTQGLRGTHDVLAPPETFLLRLRGAHHVFNPYTQELRGTHTFFESFLASLRGTHAVMFPRTLHLRGLQRAADSTIALYEIYRGTDAAPDLTASPWETFSTLPDTTTGTLAPPGAGNRTYYFTVWLRNRFNVASQNVDTYAVTIDSNGDLVSISPSPPVEISISPRAGGTMLVDARYLYAADGDFAADQWLVYLTSDGSDPDPVADTPVVVTMRKRDGVAKLAYTTGAYSNGLTIKTLVRARRSATPDVDSTNTAIVSAVASTTGPTAPAPGAHWLKFAEQHQ